MHPDDITICRISASVDPAIKTAAVAFAAPWLLDGFFAGNKFRIELERELGDSPNLWLVASCGEPKTIGALATAILQSDAGDRTLGIYLVGGCSIGRWGAQLYDAICAFAEAEGCVGIEYQGRPEWARYFPSTRLRPQTSRAMLQ